MSGSALWNKCLLTAVSRSGPATTEDSFAPHVGAAQGSVDCKPLLSKTTIRVWPTRSGSGKHVSACYALRITAWEPPLMTSFGEASASVNAGPLNSNHLDSSFSQHPSTHTMVSITCRRAAKQIGPATSLAHRRRQCNLGAALEEGGDVNTVTYPTAVRDARRRTRRRHTRVTFWADVNQAVPCAKAGDQRRAPYRLTPSSRAAAMIPAGNSQQTAGHQNGGAVGDGVGHCRHLQRRCSVARPVYICQYFMPRTTD